MNAVPRLSIGLPVYNGEKYLAEALEALLGQSYEDFELIISDNASTDGTAGICRRYEKQDSRIRYVRQPRNIGLVPNHNFVVGLARGELFKWAAHDDLYARDLLKRCVDALDENPQAVFAHSWSAIIDSSATPTKLVKYPEATASPRAPERFRSMLSDGKSRLYYGIVRTDVLRRTPLHDSYHYADRTLVTEIALHGPFCQVPDWLYFRRDHPGQPRPDGARAVRDHGPSPGGPAAEPGCSPVRGIYLGVPVGNRSRAAVARGAAGVLSPPGAVAGQPGDPGGSPREPVGEPVGERLYFQQQPVLYLSRRVASLILPGRDVRTGEAPPAEQPVISVDAVVPGRNRGPR